MRKSDNQYEDIEVDDPVAHTEKNFRREFMEAQLAEGLLFNVLGEGIDIVGPDQPRSVITTVDMITDVLNSETLHSALASLITRVLDSEQFQKACQTLLKNLWNDLVNDPETTAQVIQLLQNAIQNREIQRSVKKLVLQIINDKEVYDELTKLLVRLGQEKEVLQATQNLLTESAHNALNDPEILDHSMEFATDVVGDDIVQRTSGEALRNTVTYAVRPGLSTFLSIVGVVLFMFGLSALVNSRASEHEAAIVEKAMSTVARNIQSTTVEGVTALLSLPGRLLSACLSLLTSIATFPIKLIQRGFSTIGQSGEVTWKAIASAVGHLTRLPAALFRTTVTSIGHVGKSISDGTSRAVAAVLATISASFVGVGVRAFVSSVNSLTTGLSAALHVLAVSSGAAFAGILSAVGKATTWVEQIAGSMVTTSEGALDAVVNAAVVVSNAVGYWASKLIEMVTKRGGNGSSSTKL